MSISLFSQKCTVIKQVATTDDIGRPSTYTRTVVHKNLKCRLNTVQLRSIENVEPGSSKSIMKNVLYTDYKNDITADMQIELDGFTFNIISINGVRGFISQHHLQIEILRTENA